MADDVAAPVRWRVFPAKVTGPGDRVFDKVAAIASIDGLFVYEHVGRQIVTVLAIDPYTAIRNDRGVWYVMDRNGDEWAVGKGGGCGCGSPLRRMANVVPKYLNVGDPETVRV